MQAVTAAVEEAGYFDTHPLLVDLTPDQALDCEAVATILMDFDGQGSWRVSKTSVAAFVGQFPPGLRSEMLGHLKKIQFLGRSHISRTILKTFDLHWPSTAIDVVALSPSSGQMVRTWLKQELGSTERASRCVICNDLRECLKADNHSRPLVFVDDNINSAIQARAQFFAWAGIVRHQRPLILQGEDGISDVKLPSEELELLRAREIWIVTCAGSVRAGEALREALNDILFTSFGGVRYDTEIEGADGFSSDLKSFLCTVGRELIASTNHGTSFSDLPNEKQEECAGKEFGYGNVGSLLATAINVPTSTVTAIWSPGIFAARGWMPLMIRRNKLRHLVVS